VTRIDPDFGERSEFYTFAPESLSGLLPDYDLVREVGKGSMGIVFEARRKTDGARFAIKVLPPSLTLTEQALARFLREGELMRRIDHPGIAKVIDLGQRGRLSWFVMAFVDGVDLGERLRVGPLPLRQAAEIAARVGRILHFAHERGIVHRDVKPDNLILREDGSVVVTDFGLARETGTGSMTESGAIVGTPMFMAPEQVLGNRGQVGARSDVYSLGATLYALIAGRPPFDGPTAQSVLKQVLEQPPRRLRSHRTEVPLALEAIVHKAMERDPARRYGTTAEFADDLEAWLAGRRPLARLPGPARRTWRAMAARPLVTSMVATIVVLALGGWVLLRERQRSEHDRSLAEVDRTLARASSGVDELGRRVADDVREQMTVDAIARVNTVLLANPRSARAHFTRGKAHHQLRRYAEAIDDLDRAEQLAGEATPELLLYRIDARSRLRDVLADAALQTDLRTLLDTDPSPRNRCIVAGHMLDMADRTPDRARDALLEATARVIGEKDPEDAHDYIVRARLEELRGEFGAARATVLDATRRFPGDAFTHAAAAEILRRMGFEAEGELAADLARRIDPRTANTEQPAAPAEGIDVDAMQDFVHGVRGLLEKIEKK
jgi:tetratricopeptide (TPR) repeat protein